MSFCVFDSIRNGLRTLVFGSTRCLELCCCLERYLSKSVKPQKPGTKYQEQRSKTKGVRPFNGPLPDFAGGWLTSLRELPVHSRRATRGASVPASRRVGPFRCLRRRKPPARR